MKILKKIRDKIMYSIVLLQSLLSPMITFGTEIEIEGGDEGAAIAAAKELKKILTNEHRTGLMDIVQSAGWIVIAFGIGQMIFAFKDDNADMKSKSAMILMAGVFCVSIKMVLKQIGAL